jgi:hypothetical protein
MNFAALWLKFARVNDESIAHARKFPETANNHNLKGVAAETRAISVRGSVCLEEPVRDVFTNDLLLHSLFNYPLASDVFSIERARGRYVVRAAYDGTRVLKDCQVVIPRAKTQ